MPQLNSAVLKDGLATPVNHTFVPRDIVGGVATLTESTGVPIGDKRISASLTTTSGDRRKATFKMVLPVLQDAVVNGVTRPTVVRTSFVDVTFSFDGASSKAERNDARAYLASLLSDTMFSAVITDLSNLY